MSIDMDGPGAVNSGQPAGLDQDLDSAACRGAASCSPQPQAPAQLYVAPPEWVAVKIFKPLVQCDLRSLEYLKREVVNQRRLQHPHVIGFKDVGITTDMRLYLALEYADSGTLKHWLANRGGRLPEESARWFAQQLVYGLAYCHTHGVYNRDIKPENLLLHSNWQEHQQQPLQQPLLKVADFGLCKSSADSVPNSCVGSPHYMAPEVFTGKEYDGRKADVFSCGVVLYQMVFGTLPFTRTLDGRKLDFSRDFKQILDNMRQELWPQLLPHLMPPAAVAAAAPKPADGAPPHPHPHPPTPPQAYPDPQPGPESEPGPERGLNTGSGVAVGAGVGHPEPSPGLLDLLHGMLRYDPAKRLSLYDVKRHPWYREGLTEECYAVLLSGDVDGPDRAVQPWMQSVDLIEAQFSRIIAHCTALQQAAATRHALDDGVYGA